jgi:formylmethanofuran dehydrogenase subunit A
MPGGVDIHTHIAGPKINSGRVLRPEDHRYDALPKRGALRSGTGSTVPSSFVIGYRYSRMGYTTVMEAAGPPLEARHIHEEFEDMPFLDRGFLVLAGNNYFVQKFLRNGDKKALKDFISWLINASGAYGLKIVNPGQAEDWKNGIKQFIGLDERNSYFNLTPREILLGLAEANETAGLPHPIHVHTNNLAQPGNSRTTVDTLEALRDVRAHITHIQFSSYGLDEKSSVKFRSGSGEVADSINSMNRVSVDVGQIIFGDTTTMTADSLLEYGLHKLTGNKWVNTDVEFETGSGIVPMNYRRKNLVNGIQWAIGLELFLKISDPWKVFLTTDNPNAGPFTAYPHIIKLLMSRDYRNELITGMHPRLKKFTDIAELDREYSLEEIAIITRSGPARTLGMPNKGHLGPGADADVTVYSPLEGRDIEEVFSLPEWVIKGGEILTAEGEMTDQLSFGKTLITRPDYDKGITELIREDFRELYSISLENYPVSSEYMPDIEVIPCTSKE